MLQSRRIVVTLATLAALAVVPATASAASSNVSTSAGVQAHVTKAKKAVKALKRAAKADNNAAVKTQLQSLARSPPPPRRMRARWPRVPDSAAAARSLVLADTGYDQLIATSTALVDEVTGQAQTLLAQLDQPEHRGSSADPRRS